MNTADRITEAVFEAIEIVNQQLPADRRLDCSPDTPLAGRHGKLDSLGLVNFILAVEECILRRFDMNIVLTDDSVVSREEAIFGNVRSLAIYIGQIMAEKSCGTRQA